MYLRDLVTGEQNEIRQMIRKFVDREIMPIRERLEEDYDLVKEVYQKLVDLGIQKMGYPPEYGGNGPCSKTQQAIVGEELARGDPGIAVSIGINSGLILQGAVKAGNRAVLEEFAPGFCGTEPHYGCLAMTDSAGGADTENPLFSGAGITTTAVLAGDEWIINGSKSWPSHAGIASVYVTVCTTDAHLKEDGIALIFVPGNAAGLSFGKPERKIGFKTMINASIFYDNVRVPKRYRLAGPGMDARFYAGQVSGGQWHSSVISLGIAQAAFDLAVSYTEGRRSGGKPVREWSMVAGIIAEMAVRLEMMRAGVYNYAWMLDHPEIYGPPFCPEMSSKAAIARIFCADGCVWIANKAVELMGSNGLSPEYHLEKYLRDAKITQVWLGGQQVSRYRVVRGYYDYAIS